MFEDVISFIRGSKVWPKSTLRKGWEVNDARNNIRLNSHKELGLFRCVTDKITYAV